MAVRPPACEEPGSRQDRLAYLSEHSGDPRAGLEEQDADAVGSNGLREQNETNGSQRDRFLLSEGLKPPVRLLSLGQ